MTNRSEGVDLQVARALLGYDVKRDGVGTIYVDGSHSGTYTVVTVAMLKAAVR